MERHLKDALVDGKFSDVTASHRHLMQSVRGKGNRTTESRLRFAMVRASVKGWKANYRGATSTPDFFFPNERIAIFTDGCFWHGCQTCGHIPKKNNAFWDAKITRNRERDEKNTITLQNQGILVLRFWEHDILHSLSLCIAKIKAVLGSRRLSEQDICHRHP